MTEDNVTAKSEDGRSRAQSGALLALAVAAVVAPQLMRFIPFHITGLSENRVLAQWPAPPLTWAAVFEYPARLNANLTDNFPLRSELIILSNLARYQLGYSTQP